MRPQFLIAAAFVAVVASAAVAQPLRGRVEQRNVQAPDGHTVLFNIYLPENYDASGQRYPVVYHLHGIGGNQGGPQNTTVPRSFEMALAAGTIGPVIIVFPNGYTNAWWADSANSPKPAESDVMDVLIPHVDSAFRTIPAPGARAIQGFSMGGFGATKFYTKFHDRFACCVEYDGALVTWQNMLQFHAALAQEVFDNSEALYNQCSAWYWTTRHTTALRSGPPIRMVVGSLVPGNQAFRDHLLGLQVPVDYVETTCGHELGCLLTAQGQASAAFIASHLDLWCAPPVCAVCDSIDFNQDGLFPDNQDVDDFLGVFGGGPCSNGVCGDTDFNNDGLFPDNADVEAFLRVLGGGPC